MSAETPLGEFVNTSVKCAKGLLEKYYWKGEEQVDDFSFCASQI